MNTTTNGTDPHRPLHRHDGEADPAVSPDTKRRIEQTRHAAEATGRAYARENVAGAFELIRRPLPAATTLVLDKDEDLDGDTVILLLAVRGSDNRLLWAHDEYDNHPDAAEVPAGTPPDAYGDLITEAQGLLRTAYDQPGSHLAPAAADAYRGLREHRSWNLLEAHLPLDGTDNGASWPVAIVGPDDDIYEFSLTADDSVVMLLDGLPFVGALGSSGVGWWPDGEGTDWQPLTPGAKVTYRTLYVLGMSEAQFYGLIDRLRLPLSRLGRFGDDPGELRNITLDSSPWSCGHTFDAAVDYVKELGLAFDLTVETKHESRPAAEPAAGNAAQ